jgi:hypothetical protein
MNKIIEMAPLNTPADGNVPADANSLPLTVEIRNGSGKGRAAAAWKSQLASQPQFSVIKIGNASGGSYSQTVLVDLTDGQKPQLISQLQQLTKSALVSGASSLPAGEASSSADALLIVGQN